MGLSVGIVGLPNVGKSPIFNAITAAGAESANYPFCTIEPNVGVVDVPDEKLERIHHFIETHRIVAPSGKGVGNKFLGNIKGCDAILHVVRCFTKGDVIHVSGSIDPLRDMEIIEIELALADLDTVTRNLERVAKKAKANDKEAAVHKEIFEKARAELEAGEQLRAGHVQKEEREALKPLFLITMKPVMFVANVADDDMEGQGPEAQRVREYAQKNSCEFVPLCGDIEGEIMKLPPEERGAFLADAGLKEPGLNRLVKKTYDLLGLQTYYTAGKIEIKAWTIHRGDTAPLAAGRGHHHIENDLPRPASLP